MALPISPNPQGAEAGGSPVQGQPGLYRATLSQKRKENVSSNNNTNKAEIPKEISIISTMFANNSRGKTLNV